MNTPLNVLWVSIAFPPKRDSECLQVAKYFQALSKKPQFCIDVVTSQEATLFMTVDASLRKLSQGVRQQIVVPIFEHVWLHTIKRKLWPNSVCYPDGRAAFHHQWRNVIQQLRQKPDIIYSRSFPLSSTIMALRLQQALKIPWVLHLSDPWTLSPIHRIGEGKAKQWNTQMEALCLQQASAVSFTSSKTLQLYERAYPSYRQKMHIFPNVYDDTYSSMPHRFRSKLRLVYTGVLDAHRPIKALLQAFDFLQKQSPQIAHDFELVIAGDVCRQTRWQLHANKPYLHYVGKLTFEQALHLQQLADVLLLIEDEQYAQFFLSKLPDYHWARRRILALTTPNSITWLHLQNALADCVPYDDSNTLVEVLILLWRAWSARQSDYFTFSHALDKTFSASYQADRLAALLLQTHQTYAY